MTSIRRQSIVLLAILMTSSTVRADELCPKKLEIAEEVIIECNEKVIELDGHIKLLQMKISEKDKFIGDQEKYIDSLEDFAKDNDPGSFWNRNKMLIGFIGGVLLTTGAVIGASQLTK